MTTQKPLPKDLKQLEQKTRFKQFYKQHTVEQLEEKLIEADVEYGNDENKAALVWRFMDAKGLDFDDAANDKAVEVDSPMGDAQPVYDEPITPTVEEIKDDATSAQTAPKTDDGENIDATNESEQPSQSTDHAASPIVGDDESLTEASIEHEEDQAPVSINDDSASTSAGSSEEQPSAGNQADPNGNSQDLDPPADDTPEVEAEHVEVTNTGSYNFYETATNTMVLAKKATKIYTTPTIDKAHILRNIEQHNHTRGKNLHVHN